MFRHLVVEFYGTVLFGIFQQASFGDANTIFTGLWSCILCTGVVSGSHFNPIVTIGLLLRDAIVDSVNKKKVLKALLYVVAQFVGYFIAAYISWACLLYTSPSPRDS